MTDTPTLIVDTDHVEDSEWVEIPRSEAIQRIENMLTLDLVAFEIDVITDNLPIGQQQSSLWFRITDDDDQSPVLLAVRDPVRLDAPLRWFLHRDLVAD